MSGNFLTTITIEINDEENDKYHYFEIEVEGYIEEPWKGSPLNCPSSDDYYGYQEIKGMEVLDWEYYEGNDEDGFIGDVTKIPDYLWARIDANVFDIDFFNIDPFNLWTGFL